MKKMSRFVLRAIMRIWFPYRSIEELVQMIDNTFYRDSCFQILEENRDIFSKSPGSKFNHHIWSGGYLDYVAETMNTGVVLYSVTNALRLWHFSLSDMLFVLFLHNLEVPWEISGESDNDLNSDPVLGKSLRSQDKKFGRNLLNDYVIHLNEEQKDALYYIRCGSNSNVSIGKCMTPMAVMCYMIKVLSIGAWHDFPLQKGEDPWRGNLPRSIKHETCSCGDD